MHSYEKRSILPASLFSILITSGLLAPCQHSRKENAVNCEKSTESIDIKRQIHWLIKNGKCWTKNAIRSELNGRCVWLQYANDHCGSECAPIGIELNSTFESIKWIICFIWLWRRYFIGYGIENYVCYERLAKNQVQKNRLAQTHYDWFRANETNALRKETNRTASIHNILRRLAIMSPCCSCIAKIYNTHFILHSSNRSVWLLVSIVTFMQW